MINFSKYKTYDDTNGRGSPEEWKNSFKDRAYWHTFATEENIEVYQKETSLKKCKTKSELTKVFRSELMKCHPDIAGDTKDNTIKTQQLIALYERLKQKLK